jgi:nicotinate-nucleotide pyrophosphorylase (carboxylating)
MFLDQEMFSSFSHMMFEPIIRNALIEDLGSIGDITTQALVPQGHYSKIAMVSRHNGILAGCDIVKSVFDLFKEKVCLSQQKRDGDTVKNGDIIAVLEGASQVMLAGERTALNFISHLSGIASLTHQLVEAIKSYKTQVVCTRKTTPGLRIMEKYAVCVGGGRNHRFALYDSVLIKDNHIAIAGGIEEAFHRAKSHCGHMKKIEIEVDTIEQLESALKVGADAILLDNMSLQTLHKAVRIVDGSVFTEASGSITAETIKDVAATGVDSIAVGWITHSAPILDIAFDFQH